MSLDEIRELLRYEFITVTDLPTATGTYRHGPGDELTIRDYWAAGTGPKTRASPRDKLFWVRLGIKVAEHRVARCHGCAAFAAQKMFYGGVAGMVFIVGVRASDHHLCIVSPSGDLRGEGSIVVDVWQYNLDRQRGGALNVNVLADAVGAHRYTQGGAAITEFCRYC